MGLYDRDYMREPRPLPRTVPRTVRRSPLPILAAGLLSLGFLAACAAAVRFLPPSAAGDDGEERTLILVSLAGLVAAGACGHPRRPLWIRLIGILAALLFCITGFVMAMRLLGFDVLELALHHDMREGGSGIPVLEGLVRVAPWWLLLGSVVAGACARSVDEDGLLGGLSTLGSVMLVLSVPYLGIKLLTDIGIDVFR